MSQWYVYMIRASDQSLYTGITTDFLTLVVSLTNMTSTNVDVFTVTLVGELIN